MAAWHGRGWQAVSPVRDLAGQRYDAGFVYEHEWLYFLEGAELMGVPGGFRAALDQEGRKLASLCGLELDPVFIHRDFQSRNVMMKGRSAVLVDWQGSRLGPPFYDLGSLVYDPYVDLPAGAPAEILGRYLEARGAPAGRPEYEDRTRFFGMVRLLQAAGAYAHLSRERGLSPFAAFLPRAVERALGLASSLPHVFPGLTAFLDDYAARLPGLLAGMGVTPAGEAAGQADVPAPGGDAPGGGGA
jgi:hypothetical protein